MTRRELRLHRAESRCLDDRVGARRHQPLRHRSQLSTIFYYVGGSGARTNDGVPLPDRNEPDLTVDYRRTEGRMRGLWLRFRRSFLDEAGNPRTQKEMRVILNYDLPLIRVGACRRRVSMEE